MQSKLIGLARASLLGLFATSALFTAATAQVDEVRVTSQFREQSQQDVPLAVSAYNETLLKYSGVDDIRELTQVSPSFQASSNVSDTNGFVIRIRGVGTQSNNPAFESAVGVFIDGVYRARAGIALAELMDVERIEVLRGPQGTLFGRNTTAGALSIITKKPEHEFGGSLEFSYGSFDDFDARVSLTGPIVENKLAFRVSAMTRDRDGQIDLIDNNVDRNKLEDVEDKDRVAFRAQLLFTPSDKVSFRLIGDWRQNKEECCYPVTIENGVAASIINNLLPGTQIDPPRPFDRQATSNWPLQQDVEDWGLSGELNVDLGFAQLVSITAYRKFTEMRSTDIDFSNSDLIRFNSDGSFETFSQEVRLQGTAGRLDWIVGIFYAHEDIISNPNVTLGDDYEGFINARLGGLMQLIFGAGNNYTGFADFVSGGAVAPGTGWAGGLGAIGDHFNSDNDSFSIFTHNVFNVTEQFQLIAGFRFTWDKKQAIGDLNNDPANAPGCVAIRPFLQALPNFTLNDALSNGDSRRVKDVLAALGCLGIASPAFSFDLEQKVSEWSGIFGFSYRFSEQVMVYAHYSRGYKAGGINLDRAGTILTLTGDNTDPLNFLSPIFQPETVDNFEVGMKSNLLNRRLQLNVALFYASFDNFQLNTFTGFNFTPENVEKVKSYGFEVEFIAVPTAGLQIFGGVTYAHTDYGDNLTDLTNILNNMRGFRDGTTLLPEGSPLSGRQLTNAPRWVVTLAATYSFPITDKLEIFVHGDMRYSSTFNTGSDLDAVKQQEGFTLVNMRVGLASIDGKYSLEFWVKNLFDKNYYQVAFDIPLQSNDGFGAFLGEERTMGVTGRVNF